MLPRSTQVFLAATILALGFAAGPASALPASSQLWSDISPDAIAPAGERVITPERSRTLVADREALGTFLAGVPLEGTEAATNRAVLELPLPGGGFGRYSIVESPILAPELGARYPEIRTYSGYGLDDRSATVRLDLTPAGFHAFILSTEGTVYIDPFQRDDDVHYQSYFKRDYALDETLGGCTVLDEEGMAAEIASLVAEGLRPSGTELRTYRAAVAATGEYTNYHGGTVALGLAAVTTSMNRVTGIFEREAGSGDFAGRVVEAGEP